MNLFTEDSIIEQRKIDGLERIAKDTGCCPVCGGELREESRERVLSNFARNPTDWFLVCKCGWEMGIDEE